MEQDEEPGFRPIGDLLPTQVTSPTHSASTPAPPPTNSATTGSHFPAAKLPSSIGTALSVTDAARSLREIVNRGSTAEINAAVLDSLKAYVSLSHQLIETDDPVTTYRDSRIVVDVLCDRDEAADAKRILEEAMRPALRVELIKALGRLRALTISRTADGAESAMIFTAFADELAEWPGDAVMSALAEWPRTHKFWPTLSEILDEVRKLADVRLALEHHLSHAPSADDLAFREAMQADVRSQCAELYGSSHCAERHSRLGYTCFRECRVKLP
jgi:hypothetical protein